jgi:hypothetical protein
VEGIIFQIFCSLGEAIESKNLFPQFFSAFGQEDVVRFHGDGVDMGISKFFVVFFDDFYELVKDELFTGAVFHESGRTKCHR